MAGAVAPHPRQGKRNGIVGELRFQYQADVLAPDGDRAAVSAAGFVIEAAEFGEIARIAGIAANGAVAGLIEGDFLFRRDPPKIAPPDKLVLHRRYDILGMGDL